MAAHRIHLTKRKFAKSKDSAINYKDTFNEYKGVRKKSIPKRN